MKLISTRFAAIVVCLTVSFLMTGCGSSSSTVNSSSASAGISGNWQMSLQPADSGDPKSQSGFLLQSGNVISGGVIVSDNPCSGVGTVTGTVSGSDVSLVVTLSGIVINLSGTVSGQNAMSGNYNVLAAGCEWPGVSPQTGTWTATQIPPLNGNISGTLTSNAATSGTFGITGQLTQGANTGISTAPLTGTISIPGYCFTSANLVGTVSGTAVTLNLVDSNGAQIGEITSVLNGNSLSGHLSYLGQGTGGAKGCVNAQGGKISLTL